MHVDTRLSYMYHVYESIKFVFYVTFSRTIRWGRWFMPFKMKTSKKFRVLLPIKIDSRWGFLKVSVWNIYVWVFTPWIFKGLFEIIVPSLMHTVHFCNNSEVNRSALLQCKYREWFLTGEDTDAQLEYHISTSKC